MRRLVLVLALCAVFAGGCRGDDGADTDTTLEIESRTGYAVIVDNRGGEISIGFSNDRDAAAGEAFDVTESVWRIEEGPWIEPPATCLGKGQRVELGIAQVENEARPGLLNERVVWLVCLPPEE